MKTFLNLNEPKAKKLRRISEVFQDWWLVTVEEASEEEKEKDKEKDKDKEKEKEKEKKV